MTNPLALLHDLMKSSSYFEGSSHFTVLWFGQKTRCCAHTFRHRSCSVINKFSERHLMNRRSLPCHKNQNCAHAHHSHLHSLNHQGSPAPESSTCSAPQDNHLWSQVCSTPCVLRSAACKEFRVRPLLASPGVNANGTICCGCQLVKSAVRGHDRGVDGQSSTSMEWQTVSHQSPTVQCIGDMPCRGFGQRRSLSNECPHRDISVLLHARAKPHAWDAEEVCGRGALGPRAHLPRTVNGAQRLRDHL